MAQRLHSRADTSYSLESILARGPKLSMDVLFPDIRSVNIELYNSLLCDPLDVGLQKVRECDLRDPRISILQEVCTLFDTTATDFQEKENDSDLDAFIDFSINSNLNFLSTVRCICQRAQALYSKDIDVRLLISAIFRLVFIFLRRNVTFPPPSFQFSSIYF